MSPPGHTLIHNRLPAWFVRVKEAAAQAPLIETCPTLASLEGLVPGEAPRAVFVGLGICSSRQTSRALPVDVLGVLLPAERIRRAAGAAALLVVVADEHAASNGLDEATIRSRTRQTVCTLQKIRSAGLAQMCIVRASSFHGSASYQSVLAEVRRRAPRDEHPYVLYEAADIEYLHRRRGGILKVGWTISASDAVERRQDELMFDRRFRAWIGPHVGFVYCKAGRTLDARQPKACPYLTIEPRHRVCLAPDEQVASKITSAGQSELARGVRRHLKRIARSYHELVQPLSGPTERRIQTVIAHIFAGAEAAPARRMASTG